MHLLHLLLQFQQIVGREYGGQVFNHVAPVTAPEQLTLGGTVRVAKR